MNGVFTRPISLLVYTAFSITSVTSCGSSSFTARDEINSPTKNSSKDASAKPLGSQGTDPIFQNASTGVDNPNQVDQFEGLSHFNVKRICSNKQTKAIGTNIVAATNGLSLKFAPKDGGVPLTVTDTAGLREQIINSARFELQLSKYKIPDGTYDIYLCDSRNTDTCGDGSDKSRGTLGTFKDVKIDKSSATVGETSNVLTNANIKDTKMRESYLNMFTSLVGGKEPDPAAILGQFASNIDMNDLPQECDKAQSPLLVDLSGNGIKVSAPLAGIKFDLDADGVKEQISWPTNAGNAFVALDLNQNGIIDNGAELFGNSTPLENGTKASNGFLALAQYDSNLDGKIDNSDAIYKNLVLWNDANQNGSTEAGELTSLAESNVASIRVDYENTSEFDQYQNEVRQRSSIKLIDGSARSIVDLWFRSAY